MKGDRERQKEIKTERDREREKAALHRRENPTIKGKVDRQSWSGRDQV